MHHSPEITVDGKNTKQAYLRLKRVIAILKHSSGVSRNLVDRMDHIYANLEVMQPPDGHSGHDSHPLQVDKDRFHSCIENMHVVRVQLNQAKNDGHLNMRDSMVLQSLRDLETIENYLLHAEIKDHGHHEHHSSHGAHGHGHGSHDHSHRKRK